MYVFMTPKKEENVVIKDFLAKRYAQIYVEKFRADHKDAEAWVSSKIKKEERKEFQKYVIEELKRQGFTNINPGE